MDETFGNYSILGKAIPRVDAKAKVTGQAKYAADIRSGQYVMGPDKEKPLCPCPDIEH